LTVALTEAACAPEGNAIAIITATGTLQKSLFVLLILATIHPFIELGAGIVRYGKKPLNHGGSRPALLTGLPRESA
jgi:hypothetical protein